MSKPPFTLTIGGAIVFALVSVTLLFPIYQLPNGEVVRRFVGSPPVVSIPSSLDLLAKNDVDRLDRDPAQRAILDSMRSAPKRFSPPAIWFGYKDSPAKNCISIFAIVVVIAFLCILRSKGIA